MIQLTPINADNDAERRQALANVYSLLLKLADEAEEQKAPPDNFVTDEKEFVTEPTFVQLELINS